MPRRSGFRLRGFGPNGSRYLRSTPALDPTATAFAISYIQRSNTDSIEARFVSHNFVRADASDRYPTPQLRRIRTIAQNGTDTWKDLSAFICLSIVSRPALYVDMYAASWRSNVADCSL